MSKYTTHDVGYALKVGEAGKERLKILNAVENPHTHSFIKNIGIKKGSHILELGCGTGDMTVWLAKQVGKFGKITAIDASEEQIELTKKLAIENNVSNIDAKVVSAYELEKLNLEVDYIYSRFVLIHLVEAHNVLLDLKKLLKNGGIMIMQDIIDLSFKYNNSTLNRFREIFRQYNKKSNKDFNMGYKYFSLFNQMRMKILDCKSHNTILTTENEKLQYYRAMVEVKDVYVKSGLISEDEAVTLIKELKSLAKDPDLMLIHGSTVIIAAQKNSSF